MHAETLRDTHPRAHDLLLESATPEPLDWFPQGAGGDRRHALVKITYVQPVLKPALRDSYGMSQIELQAKSL